MTTLQRIAPVSAGKVCAILHAIIGFIFFSIYGIILIIVGLFFHIGGVFVGLGIAAIIIAPVFYGILGFLIGLLSAAIYNYTADQQFKDGFQDLNNDSEAAYAAVLPARNGQKSSAESSCRTFLCKLLSQE